MPDTLTFNLPYPPALRSYYVIRGGRPYLSNEAKAYKRVVWALWVNAGKPRFDGRVGMSVNVHCPDNRTRDLDNLGKAVLDATKDKFFGDDCCIDDLRYVRCAVRKGGLLVVTLWEM
jgi:Holliday junction resolvase RusA-like endonuclease